MSLWPIHHIPGGLAIVFLMVACATPVHVPEVQGVLPENSLQTIPLPDPALLPPAPLLAAGWVMSPVRAGDQIINGVTLTPPLEHALTRMATGDFDGALVTLSRAVTGESDPLRRWYLAVQQVQALNLAGRASEAEVAADTVREHEMRLRNNDLVARTLRGDARVRLGDYVAAQTDYQRVLQSLGGWEFPVSYAGPPANMTDLALTTEARTRALLGLTFVHMMQDQPHAVLHYGTQTEQHLAALFSVAFHPLYGRVLGKPMPDLYLARAVNLAFLGSALVASKRSDAEAAPYFQAAEQWFAACSFAQGPVYLAALRAKAHLLAGHFDKAEQLAQQAGVLARQSGLVDFVWRVRALEAEALLAAGHHLAAEQAFRDAQQAVEQITGMIPGDREKRRFGIGKDDITYRLAQLGFAHGKDHAQLFADLERGRARAFVDLLSTLHPGRGLPVMQALEQLDQQASQLVARLENQSPDPLLQQQLAHLIAQRPALIARLQQQHPAWAETRGVARSDEYRLVQVQHALAEKESLLYFLPMRDNDPIRALFIERTRTALLEFPLRAGVLRTQLQQLAQAIADENVPAQTALARQFSAALDVRRWQGQNRLLVVPSGPLYGLPWGMTEIAVPVIVMPTGRWPLQGHLSTSSVLSAQKAVVVGDPDFAGRLPQLPGARIEAEQVATQYRVRPLLGQEVSEQRLREAVGDGASLLHLATHGHFHTRNPLRSAVYLREGIPLTAARLFENPLPARVVVLSACETGMGQAVAGEDYLGLARSFYLGGTRTLLSSLWPVDDAGTLNFMQHLHQRAARQPAPDFGQAWLSARNALRDAGAPPWVYGAFVLGGLP